MAAGLLTLTTVLCRGNSPKISKCSLHKTDDDDNSYLENIEPGSSIYMPLM